MKKINDGVCEKLEKWMRKEKLSKFAVKDALNVLFEKDAEKLREMNQLANEEM